jgi:hypothetical protein
MKILENIQLTPLSCDFSDFKHKILYAIAYAHESEMNRRVWLKE